MIKSRFRRETEFSDIARLEDLTAREAAARDAFATFLEDAPKIEGVKTLSSRIFSFLQGGSQIQAPTSSL